MATATIKQLDALLSEASDTQTKYENGLQYHKQMGYQTEWPLYERFKANDQWPAPTEKTRNLPRPVFNIIELIESLKVSMILSEQLTMKFNVQDSGTEIANEAADLFTRYSDTIWENIKQNELNEEMLDIAANVGTGIIHYYWDNDYVGGNHVPYAGRICGEVLDPINVFFGNPQERDVQKQPYIVISYRDMLANVKREAKESGLSKTLLEMITPDGEKRNEGYDAAQVEVQDTQKVTVLLHYFKKNGTVWFRKVASGIPIKRDTDTGMRLYPIAVMQWKRRRKSIHGVGDTKGLIPNQRAINTLIAMSILSAQLTGWPKMAIDPQRVDKHKITNTPGEIVEVSNANQGLDSAIKFLNPGSISSNVPQLVEQIITLTRSMSSANEVATGEAPGANMAAAAIIQLQKANGVPIENVKRRFYQFIEDVGRIWEEFFKTKFNMPREIKVKDDMGEEVTEMFLGTKYRDVNLDLKIDVGPSSMFSESLMMATLDKFLDKQYIDVLQYLKYAPSNVVPFKERLIREIEQQQELQQTAQTPTAPPNPIATLPPEVQRQFQALPPAMQQHVLQQAGIA
jgi:hypothetical protein